MFNFKDLSALESLLAAICATEATASHVDILAAILERDLHFSAEQARDYARTILARDREDSADAVRRNGDQLLGKWSKGDSSGSVPGANFLVTRTESWIFNDDLTYEHKHESYEGYMTPFGSGYSRPRSNSSFGIWAPSDGDSSSFAVVTIDAKGACRKRSVQWTGGAESRPGGMQLDRERFGRM